MIALNPPFEQLVRSFKIKYKICFNVVCSNFDYFRGRVVEAKGMASLAGIVIND